MFTFRETVDLDSGSPRVEVGFTDATLDLRGPLPGQTPRPGYAAALAAVEAEAGGVPFVRLHQVHGDGVVEAEDPWPSGPTDPAPPGDALVTARRGVGLMIRAADCVPVLLADPAAGVIGAVHAGRRGVAIDIVSRAVERMHALGARELRAWIGPHVCGRCYEVPAQMRAEVAALVPATYAETRWATPSLDLGAGVTSQLTRLGVPTMSVERCTLEDESLHSYRRTGPGTGLIAGLVWMP